MGSYAQCWLSGLYVGSSKNDVDPSLIDHFRSLDKHVVRDRHAVLPAELKHWADEHSEEDEFLVVYYKTPSRLLKDRLEVWGYTVDSCRRAFDRAVELKIEEVAKLAAINRGTESATILQPHYEAELRVLREMTAERWLELVKSCSERRELSHVHNAFNEGSEKGTLLGYMLSEDDGWYGCPIPDHNIPLRLVLDAFPEGDLVYDITDLVLGGYIDENENLIDRGISTAAEEYSYRARTLVLTEGRSDSELLRESMTLLYPHLVDYFAFMDFDATKAEGGASRLAMLVKSFAAAGIVNRTIALFDNDAAGAVAMASINQAQIPSHIVVRKLPDLDFLNSYPTEGPTGFAAANINGSAASIELMLGKDVLLDAREGLLPVRWTGLEKSIGRYQGEVTNKPAIHAKYREKLAKARSSARYLEQADWDAMRKVLAVLFGAFNDLQGKNMLAFVESYYREHLIF